MTKGRKTSFEERVEIVQYCISHNRNYAETAVKYNVSYQQARSYTVKYEAGGVEALRDRRGRTKPEEEMSELEKLRAEKRRHVKRAAQTRLQHTGWNREPIYRRLYHSSQSHGHKTMIPYRQHLTISTTREGEGKNKVRIAVNRS